MSRLFGVDHSPWTQAAVLAHADHGITVRLQPYPSFSYFLQSGLVMPVCWHGDGRQTADSLAIIQTLSVSNDAESQPALEADFTELERLFLAYALDRSGPGRRLAFIRGWAGMTDSPLTPISIALRALLCWHFLVLISAGRRIMNKHRGEPSRIDQLNRRLAPWIARLEDTPFLGGEEPSASDFGLLGHLECMCSGLTDWAMRVAGEHPKLVAWLQRMHARLTHHPTLYSRRLIDPSAGPTGPGKAARVWFFLWMILWVAAFPLTVSILVYASVQRRGAAHRTGGRLDARTAQNSDRTVSTLEG